MEKPWEPTDEEILQIEKAWFESQPQGYSGLILTAGKLYQGKLLTYINEIGLLDCDHATPTFQIDLIDWDELRREMGLT